MYSAFPCWFVLKWTNTQSHIPSRFNQIFTVSHYQMGIVTAHVFRTKRNNHTVILELFPSCSPSEAEHMTPARGSHQSLSMIWEATDEKGSKLNFSEIKVGMIASANLCLFSLTLFLFIQLCFTPYLLLVVLAPLCQRLCALQGGPPLSLRTTDVTTPQIRVQLRLSVKWSAEVMILRGLVFCCSCSCCCCTFTGFYLSISVLSCLFSLILIK